MKKNKKVKRNLLIAATLTLLLMATAGYTLFLEPRLNQEVYVYKEESVTRGNLVLGIMERGNLTMEENSVPYDLDLDVSEDEEDSETSDSSDEEEETVRYLEVEAVAVSGGERIKAGDELFRLSDSSVKAVRRKLAAAVAEARITLSEAETEYNVSLISAQSTYDVNVAAGNRAAADYQAALDISQQSVALLQAEISVLEEEITRAREQLADEELLDSLEVAKADYNNAKEDYEEIDPHNPTAYFEKWSAYQTAEQTLTQIEEERQGYRDIIAENEAELAGKQTEIQYAENQKTIDDLTGKNAYESAKLTGELAGEIYAYSTGSLADTVTAAENDLAELEEKLAAFEAFVGGDGVIRAAEDGLVIAVSYEAGDELTETGDMLTYAKEDEYTVSINVSEEDIAAVSVGDRVDLSFTAYPDTAYTGTIASITTSATTEYAATISYPITVHVEGDTGKLYGGMTADVTFVTDSAEDVLYVSRRAVFTENGKSYVYRQGEDGEREQAEVETGFSDGIGIEITRGLADGDIIYIRSTMSAAESENFETADNEAQ